MSMYNSFLQPKVKRGKITLSVSSAKIASPESYVTPISAAGVRKTNLKSIACSVYVGM